ncbi:MAG: hypothetical protein IPL61_40060 [Myxococcales bacterium]|nr:hypothetical protein [Myxococcales bacterium]
MRRALVLLVALAACGPIEYVSGVTRTAANAVDEARSVDAARFAPYWWTRSIEYLHKAREEAAHANFQAANRFGRLATDAAEHAKVDAIRRAADPSLMDEITPPRRAPSPARGGGGLAPVVDDETPAALEGKP